MTTGVQMGSTNRHIHAASAQVLASGRYRCRRLESARRVPSLAEDVALGFATRPRALPSKYFYDALGSRLFDRICDTPEYYPMRCEAALLREHSAEIIARVRPDHIIELGSGTSRKTRLLLDAADGANSRPHYWPLDVCEETLRATAEELVTAYPWLGVTALVGDYGAGLAALPQPAGRRLFLFLGGTLGNFMPGEAVRFLLEVRALMRPEDALLLGVDRVKDGQVLHEAYNDAAGVTAEFNLNLLNVINRELAGDFDRDRFSHQALYNPRAERIEMYLVARQTHEVSLRALNRRYRFEAGERLLTEISQKYTQTRLAQLLAAVRLRLQAHYLAPQDYFSLLLLSLH